MYLKLRRLNSSIIIPINAVDLKCLTNFRNVQCKGKFQESLGQSQCLGKKVIYICNIVDHGQR